MGWKDKLKELSEAAVEGAKKATETVKAATEVAKEEYQKVGGIDGLVKTVDDKTNGAIAATQDYLTQVGKDAKKAARPLGITYGKDEVAGKAAKGAVMAIHAIRRVATDASSQIKKGLDGLESKNEQTPEQPEQPDAPEVKEETKSVRKPKP